MKFTVFGASGFVGSNLARYLRQNGHCVITPSRLDMFPCSEHLGHVIYSIGLTGDFRKRLFDTIDAHVTSLAKIIRGASYDSWLYLSSTRVYGTTASVASEEDKICVTPSSDAIYDLSKLLGESLCLGIGRPDVRVVRLANVYGVGQSRHTFLGSIINEVKSGREIIIAEDPESSKDYISISDVVRLIEKISISGKYQVYNLASGTQVSHCDLAKKIGYLSSTSVHFMEGAPCRKFPRVNVDRIMKEFSIMPRYLLDDLDKLLKESNNH